MPKAAVEVWTQVQETLRDRVSSLQFGSWLRGLRLADIDAAGVARIEAPDAQTRNWVESYYRALLVEAFADNEVPVTRVDIGVGASTSGTSAAASSTAPAERARRVIAAGRIGHDQARPGVRGSAADLSRLSPVVTPDVKENTPFPESARTAQRPSRAPVPAQNSAPSTGGINLILNGNYTFDTFVTGPCNQMPHAAALAVAERPGTVYNPLFVHGNVGLGKTHLLQAICARVLDDDPGRHVLYLSCEEFVNQFIEAVERGELESFRTRYRYLDVLIIDDIHFLANKERTQEEFFHTFNALYNSQRQIILSSDAPPVEIPTIEDRLVSRFKWGLVTKIESPAYETRIAILKKKAKLQGYELPDACLHFLAENVEASIREIEGAITKVAGYARLVGKPITLPLVKEALRDLLTLAQRRISMQAIIDVVCQHYDVRLADLQSKTRKQSFTLPRQICMYLARKYTKLSLEEIGSHFGGRDHTTVIHADDKIRRLIGEDPQMQGLTERMEAQLKA